METKQFSAGDVVQLKSGGVAMTVQSVDEENAFCVWMEGKKLHREKIPFVALTEFRRTAVGFSPGARR